MGRDAYAIVNYLIILYIIQNIYRLFCLNILNFEKQNSYIYIKEYNMYYLFFKNINKLIYINNKYIKLINKNLIYLKVDWLIFLFLSNF